MLESSDKGDIACEAAGDTGGTLSVGVCCYCVTAEFEGWLLAGEKYCGA